MREILINESAWEEMTCLFALSLEGYRASDGEHLGAFDPKTGKQVKGPDPKRNIKKYL
ncbi:colicin E3/pyocin S6 family cytotoxin [Klebsiella pneumoniae]